MSASTATPSTADLLKKARSVKVAPGKVNMDPLLPVIVTLRGKNWTYLQIWEWLRQQGSPVHDRWDCFAAAASKAYKRYLEGQKS